MRAIRSAMADCAVAKDWDETAKLRTTTMMARKSSAVMWIDATGGEDELGPTGVVGVGGKECATGTGVAGIGSKARAADIVMWGS